jgi:hypothetical protein
MTTEAKRWARLTELANGLADSERAEYKITRDSAFGYKAFAYFDGSFRVDSIGRNVEEAARNCRDALANELLDELDESEARQQKRDADTFTFEGAAAASDDGERVEQVSEVLCELIDTAHRIARLTPYAAAPEPEPAVDPNPATASGIGEKVEPQSGDRARRPTPSAPNGGSERRVTMLESGDTDYLDVVRIGPDVVAPDWFSAAIKRGEIARLVGIKNNVVLGLAIKSDIRECWVQADTGDYVCRELTSGKMDVLDYDGICDETWTTEDARKQGCLPEQNETKGESPERDRDADPSQLVFDGIDTIADRTDLICRIKDAASECGYNIDAGSDGESVVFSNARKRPEGKDGGQVLTSIGK